MAKDPVDALYALPPGEFVRGRDALAAARARAGDGAGAAAIGALRRPGLTAWALNVFVRTRGPTLRAYLAASARLGQAQARHVGRGHAPDRTRSIAFDRATTAQRAALAEAQTALRAILVGAGHPASPATLEALTRVLRAAASDPAVRVRVAAARLDALPKDDPTVALLAASAAGTGFRRRALGRPGRPPAGRPPVPSRAGSSPAGPGIADAKRIRGAPHGAAVPPIDRRAERSALQERVGALRATAAGARSAARRAESRVTELRGVLAEAERLAADARGRLAAADDELAAAERKLQRS